MRGWAALAVVISHGVLALDFALFTGLATDSRTPWDIRASGTPFMVPATDGNFAVCLFFILSGYVLSRAYSKSDQTWIALAVRRYVRLGIPIAIGGMLSWATIRFGLAEAGGAAEITKSSWLASQALADPSLRGLLASLWRLMFLFEKTRGSIYDTSLWTMPIELSASLLILSVMVLCRRLGAFGSTAAGILFALAAIVWVGSYLSLFAFGAAMQLINPVRVLQFFRSNRSATFFLVAAVLFCGTVPYSAERWGVYNQITGFALHIIWRTSFWDHDPESFWHAIGACVLMILVLSSDRVKAILARPIAQFLGRISFPLYIIHVPILSVVLGRVILTGARLGWSPAGTSLLGFGVFVLVSVAGAAVAAPIMEGGAVKGSAWVAHQVEIRLRPRLPRILGVRFP